MAHALPIELESVPRELDVTALHAEHAAFLGRVIQRLVGDGPHVDDLLQETFLVAFRRRADYDEGRAAVRTWLYAIASNLCSRHRRGARRFERFTDRFLHTEVVPDAPEAPDRLLEREEIATHVRDVIARLPFKQREVFVLYELEGVSGNDIAAMAAIPVGTVWTRLHQARATARALLTRRLGKEGSP